jgi:hypothetical protein
VIKESGDSCVELEQAAEPAATANGPALADAIPPLGEESRASNELRLGDAGKRRGCRRIVSIGRPRDGYTHDVLLLRGVETGVGANVTAYVIMPRSSHSMETTPVGASISLRVRLKPIV